MPIVFYVSTELIKRLKRNSDFELSLIQILVGFLYFSTLFEVVLPLYNSKYTADWLDVLMYGIGSLIFIVIQKIQKNIYLI